MIFWVGPDDPTLLAAGQQVWGGACGSRTMAQQTQTQLRHLRAFHQRIATAVVALGNMSFSGQMCICMS